MPNFTIRWVDSVANPNGIRLVFEDTKKETLIIKNVLFYPKNYNEASTQIHTVILGERSVERFFEFPIQNFCYEKMTFQIHQNGEIGWEVMFDINTKVLLIEKSRYQIL